jgi:hypothetical protein
MLTRRDLAGLALAPIGLAELKKIRVAAVVTEYRHWSHADVIVGRLLGGYSMNGIHRLPRSRVVSLYTDQVPENDMSRDLAARHGFRIFPTIREALTLGGHQLSVDAVVFVGEHGKYPVNDVGQKMYPRFELFSQILDVYESSRRVVPTFFDKHLSYSWDKAKTLYDRAAKLRVPWMAGSSIPVTIRVPELDIPLETPLESALMAGYGDLDAYGFHTLETMFAMIERRKGGETGIAAVEMLEGEAVWRWRDSEAGSWSKPLLAAALSRQPKPPSGEWEKLVKRPALFLLDYRDGLRACCYMLNGAATNWSFATRIRNQEQPLSCSFGLPGRTRPLPHFDGLVWAIEEMFWRARPIYPVERTLLSTGALAFLFESKRAGRRVETPQLAIHYRAPQQAFFQKS